MTARVYFAQLDNFVLVCFWLIVVFTLRYLPDDDDRKMRANFIIINLVLANYSIKLISALFTNLTFVCKSGHSLNSFELVCDGRTDCYDGSDESNELCSRTVCPINKFKCHYGACVDRTRKCNGIRDCVDGSDEEHCGRRPNSCATTEFRCGESGKSMRRKCILSDQICDGVQHCDDGSDENVALCDNFLCPAGSFRCQYGGCVPAAVQCDGFRDCIDGSDESGILCLALQCPKCPQSIFCPPVVTDALTTRRIDVSCELNGQPVTCERDIRPGTKTSYSCKEYFVPINAKHENNDWSICQGDGTWSRDILKCKPDCGHLSEMIPLVVNGWEVPMPLPWHASIFINDGNDETIPHFVCGATLISEAVVITAAHCVWRVPTKLIVIGLGNTKIHYTESSDGSVIYYKAKQVITHPLYLDKIGNYGSDIALIEINETIYFSDFIQPICIDWDLDDITAHLSDQSLGLVVGHGLTEHTEYSDHLRATTMPVVPHSKCTDKHQPDFRKYITFTTFCAGWANGTGVCNGDSGAGLIFPMKRNSDQWCLQGIVSLSPRKASTIYCDPNQYTIFTKVGIYVKWIHNVLIEIHEKHDVDDVWKRNNEPIF